MEPVLFPALQMLFQRTHHHLSTMELPLELVPRSAIYKYQLTRLTRLAESTNRLKEGDMASWEGWMWRDFGPESNSAEILPYGELLSRWSTWLSWRRSCKHCVRSLQNWVSKVPTSIWTASDATWKQPSMLLGRQKDAMRAPILLSSLSWLITLHTIPLCSIGPTLSSGSR